MTNNTSETTRSGNASARTLSRRPQAMAHISSLKYFPSLRYFSSLRSLTSLRYCSSRGHLPALGLTAATLLVSSCGWVDSTGRGSDELGDSPFSVSPATSGAGGAETGSAFIELPETRLIQISENSSLRIEPNAQLRGAQDWTWTPAARGNPLLLCNTLADFNTTLGTNNLRAACSSTRDCEFSIDAEVNAQDGQDYSISAPSLKSPAALSYRLSGFFADGRTINEYYAFCLIAINEAPVAINDQFTVVRGQTLRINGDDLVTLLSNDSDDIDTSNKSLRVNTNPLRAPRLATEFILQSDGGFVYTAPARTDRDTVFDNFTYEVTDGIHTVTATATIRIVQSNAVPVVLAPIPDLRVVNGQNVSENDPAYNLANYFSDPDGSGLMFSTMQGSLPASGNLRLSPSGQLSGSVTDEDIGDYNVTLVVFDGSNSLTSTFTLSIGADPATLQNEAPVISPIDQLTIAEGDRLNIVVNATDADGDDLTYNLSANTVDFLSINANNGRLRGVASEPGLFPVTVIVSDSQSSTQRTFLLRVLRANNRAPVVDDIANAIFSQSFRYDVSVFFEDADNDAMTFTAENLPSGITISPDGVISGTPNANNDGPHFILVTANDGNRGVATDGFLLTLRP